MRKTRAAVLPAYNDNLLRAMLAITIEERDIPSLNAADVLVEMEGAPCNPSDIAFLRGGYNIVKPLPAVPGFEGTGTVVEAGKEAKEWIGRKVACFVQEENDGTWAEFFTARAGDCIVLKDGINRDQAACLSINPLTALGMLELAEQMNCGAIIQNAAGGQVPNLVQKLAAKKGIRVINLVRKAAHVDALKSRGMNDVLDINDAHFDENLKQLTSELHPAMAFDAVAGELAGKMLNVMPSGAKLVTYGALSGETIAGIDPMGIIFQRKSVMGFNLNEWLAGMSREKFNEITNSIQDMVIAGEITTMVQGTFQLDQVVQGLRAYIKSMSEGKIIFTP